jgi:hypothetical protein
MRLAPSEASALTFTGFAGAGTPGLTSAVSQ